MLAIAACLAVAAATPLQPGLPPPASRPGRAQPNFVVLFVDDMGYGDLSSYGAPTTYTPNIDALARDGIKLSLSTPNSVCTPNRAALLTGRYPVRTGMTHPVMRTLFAADSLGGLDPALPTMAKSLKTGGYRSAIFGKWHLGCNAYNNSDGTYLPRNHGFDESVISMIGNGPPCANSDNPVCFLMDQNVVVEQPMRLDNMTTRSTNHGIQFIKDAVADDQPFMLLMSYQKVHTPLFVDEGYPGQSARGGFGDNVEELDISVGRLMDTLREAGIEDDTLVIFTSDNGAYLEEREDGGSAGPFRGGKGQVWEGGVRVPAIARWTGKIAPSSLSTEPVSLMDLYPTMLSLAGVPIPDGVDGIDISPLLLEGAPAAAEDRFIFHYCGSSADAVRFTSAEHGEIKAYWRTPIWTAEDGGEFCPYEPAIAGVCGCLPGDGIAHNPPLLFHVGKDPSERKALTLDNFAAFDEVVAAVNAALQEHVQYVGNVRSVLTAYGDIDEIHPCCPGQTYPDCDCQMNE